MRVVLVATDKSPPAPARKDPGAWVVNVKRREIWHLGQVAEFACDRWGFVRNKSGLVQFRGIVALLVRRGAFVSTEEFIDAVWGDRADGGPLWATNAPSQIMRRRMLDRMRRLRLRKEGVPFIGTRLLPVHHKGGAP